MRKKLFKQRVNKYVSAFRANNKHIYVIPYVFIDRKLKSMCIATREVMDCMFEAVLHHDDHADNFSSDTKDPVYILGKKYDPTKELALIKKDIQSKIWFTYRKGFVPIGGGDGFTTDRGWGCMLRCGQMVLAQALVLTHLGPDWMWEHDCKDPTYLKILKKFEDVRQAPFSLHQIALMGISEGKEVGEWFGPNTIAQVLKKLIKYDESSSVVIHVALDNMVVVAEVRETSMKSGKKWTPLILIVPLRLGLSEINPIYISGLQRCFKFRQCLGVIGGKPNSAYYFIGCVGDQVIYLDPHTTQRAGNVENKQTEAQIAMDDTYHCKRASRMNILAMDPSIALCFYCNSQDDFEDFCKGIQDIMRTEKTPLFEVSYNKPEEYKPLPTHTFHTTDYIQSDRQYDSENEFEIL